MSTTQGMHAVTKSPIVGNLDVLLVAVASGEREAFEQLYALSQERVFGVVLRVLRDKAQAQEVTQEVFLQVWQQAARFDSLRGSASAWMMRLAHSRAVDRVRCAHSSSVRDTDFTVADYRPDVDSVVNVVLLRVEQSLLHDALHRLNAGQRQAIVMAYFGGMTTAEIAAETGVNRSTIKTRIRDGLLKLAADLRAMGAMDSLVP